MSYRAIALALVGVAALPVAAQNYGEISGTVTDSTGALVAGATITVANTATNAGRQVQTNNSGTTMPSAPNLSSASRMGLPT